MCNKKLNFVFTKITLIAFTIVILLQTTAFAVVTQSTYDAKSDAKSEVNKDDLDKEVTDIKLRNNSGKKRQYSASVFIYYSGGPINDLASDERPNVGKNNVVYPVSLSTDLFFRYRLNKNKSVFFASGLNQSTPFTNSKKEKKRGISDELELSSVFLGYNNTFAAEETQVGSSFRFYYITQEHSRANGEWASLGYSVSAQNRIGDSRLQGAMRLDLSYTHHDKNDIELQKNQSDYGLSVSPTLLWNISDRWNIFTTLNIMRYSHNRTAEFGKLKRSPSTQTVGAGFAPVRDFYISPTIQFEPESISMDETSYNLSLSVNL